MWSVHLSAPLSVGGLLEEPNSEVVCVMETYGPYLNLYLKDLSRVRRPTCVQCRELPKHRLASRIRTLWEVVENVMKTYFNSCFDDQANVLPVIFFCSAEMPTVLNLKLMPVRPPIAYMAPLAYMAG